MLVMPANPCVTGGGGGRLGRGQNAAIFPATGVWLVGHEVERASALGLLLEEGGSRMKYEAKGVSNPGNTTTNDVRKKNPREKGRPYQKVPRANISPKRT